MCTGRAGLVGSRDSRVSGERVKWMEVSRLKPWPVHTYTEARSISTRNSRRFDAAPGTGAESRPGKRGTVRHAVRGAGAVED